MLRLTRSNLPFLRRTPIYYEDDHKRYVVYKQKGVTLEDMGADLRSLPARLFVMQEDKKTALEEIQQGLSRQLKERLQAKDTQGVKDTMVTLVDDILNDPRQGNLEVAADMVGDLMQGFMGQVDVLRAMAFLSFTDYSTALHSANVMVLTLSFAMRHELPRDQCQTLALAGLLHDLGKTKVPKEILTADRRLTDPEFELMRAHATHGYNLLRKTRLGSGVVALAAWQHHEKLDGSGYPRAITTIPMPGRLLGIIDCYEAITCDTRPYRQAMDPFGALQVIQKDVSAGKLDKKLFDKFVLSLF